jgi:hypothetical protein
MEKNKQGATVGVFDKVSPRRSPAPEIVASGNKASIYICLSAGSTIYLVLPTDNCAYCVYSRHLHRSHGGSCFFIVVGTDGAPAIVFNFSSACSSSNGIRNKLACFLAISGGAWKIIFLPDPTLAIRIGPRLSPSRC